MHLLHNSATCNFCGSLKRQTGDCGLQTADYRLQTTDCGLQTVDYRLRTTDYRLQTTDCRPKTIIHLNIAYTINRACTCPDMRSVFHVSSSWCYLGHQVRSWGKNFSINYTTNYYRIIIMLWSRSSQGLLIPHGHSNPDSNKHDKHISKFSVNAFNYACFTVLYIVEIINQQWINLR